MNFFRGAPTLAFPLAAMVLVVTVMYFVHKPEATFISNAGTLVILLGNLAYIVFWHSRKRWPGTSAAERLKRVLTFRR